MIFKVCKMTLEAADYFKTRRCVVRGGIVKKSKKLSNKNKNGGLKSKKIT